MGADPVHALMAANRDGLLTYHGFVAPDDYDLAVAGRRWTATAAEALELVGRLRAVEDVGRATGVTARVVELTAGGSYVVHLGSLRTVLPDHQIVDWCAGFTAAAKVDGQGHVGHTDQIKEIAELFEQPSLIDQCRMVILGLMYGRGDDNVVTTEALAKKIGELPGVKEPAKKTIVDALGFGGYLGSTLAERMIQVFGLRWQVSATQPGPGGYPMMSPGASVPEMPGLARLRRIADASRQGWVRYVDNPAPNKARWKDRYLLTVGAQTYTVGAGQLDAWLDGVQAFNTRPED